MTIIIGLAVLLVTAAVLHSTWRDFNRMVRATDRLQEEPRRKIAEQKVDKA